MQRTSTPHGPAALMFQFAALLHDAAGEIRALAIRLDAWLARRQRAADTLRILDAMSERELKDIGLSRAVVHEVSAGRWVRDFERV